MTDQRPDIVFVVLDTHRADRLGCYGNQRGLSPNIDAFSAECALFKRAVSPAQWTVPSHASFFTGQYPTTHQVTQSNRRLQPDAPHLFERLSDSGYETVGFCNNPLVGVLDNGFKRGFSKWYNYGGAAPSMFRSASMPDWRRKTMMRLNKGVNSILDPISRGVSNSNIGLRLSMTALFTPIWSRLGNFKGQNERSTQDIVQFLDEREGQSDKPMALFFNLMETHLPFWPPRKYIEQTAPYLLHDDIAQRLMREWNGEAYRWAAPLKEPLSDLEAQVLSDLYDAEVAYQDDYLKQFFAALKQRKNARNTVTIVVADHGDGLGEHNCVGHAFVAYDELVHVPMMINWPSRIASAVCETAVSTRRIYHTILEASGLANDEEVARSLMPVLDGVDIEGGRAYSEIYPPMNFVNAIKNREPELLEQFRCMSLRRSLVENGRKLIQIDDVPAEMYDLVADAPEQNNLYSPKSVTVETAGLNESLNKFAAAQSMAASGQEDTFEVMDERIRQQLRGLGYIE